MDLSRFIFAMGLDLIKVLGYQKILGAIGTTTLAHLFTITIL